MKTKSKIKVLILIALCHLFSCTRAEKDETTSITLNLPTSIKQDTVDAKKFNPNGTIIPSSLSEISCYVVLVSGPEDYLRRNTCQKNNGTYFNVGFFRGGFYSGSSGNKITLEVPSGKDRVLRLVGFKIDLSGSTMGASDAQKVCESFPITSSYEQYLSDPYFLSELGQLELIGGQSKEVDMVATLTATDTIKNCQGPDFNQSSSGPPTKLAVEFQDGIGTATSQLRSTTCAAVKFKVTDANGNYPDLSSNPVISADIIVDQSGQAIGDFYNPPNSTTELPCAATNVINPTSGKINLSFNNAGQTFADRVLFFKPNSSATARFIEFKKNTFDLTDYTLNFSYNAITPVPSLAKYHLLDLFNNTSSAKATIALKRNYVRKNECRMGVLQFIDPAGAPISVTSPSTPDGIKFEDSTGGANITYFSNKTDCDNNVSGTSSIKVFSFSPLTGYSGLAFYYKIDSRFSSDFSFIITNQGVNTPMISSADLTAANNFWGIQPN